MNRLAKRDRITKRWANCGFINGNYILNAKFQTVK